MEYFAVAAPLVIFAAFLGYRFGYSKGVKVNRPVGDPAPKAPFPYDPDRDLR